MTCLYLNSAQGDLFVADLYVSASSLIANVVVGFPFCSTQPGHTLRAAVIDQCSVVYTIRKKNLATKNFGKFDYHNFGKFISP